jgi:ATP-dependent RNA helicase RhlE
MQAIGDAISFVTHDDADNLRRLERFLGRGITRKKLEGYVAAAAPPATSGAGSREDSSGDRAPRPHGGPPQRAKGPWRSKGPRSGSFGPKRFGRSGRPQGRRGRT